MTYLLLLLATIFNGICPVISKQYNNRATSQNPYLYTAVSNLFIAVFFFVSAGFRLEFNPGFLPYSIGFGVACMVCSIGMVLATKTGSLSLTSLIMAYSLILPTFHGIIFLGDDIGVLTVIGLIILLISLFLINIKKGDNKFKPIWILFVAMAFFGNGFCSIIQKMEQVAFDGGYKSEYMIFAALFTMIASLVIWLFQSKNKKIELKEAAPWGAIAGLNTGALNLAVMILTGLLPNAILFPSVSAGGIVLAFIIATFVYKEKLTKTQLVGYAAGLVSVILLNL